MNENTFRIVWWNTKLSPRGRDCEHSVEHWQAIIDFGQSMAADHQVDIIALGEVTVADTEKIQATIDCGYQLWTKNIIAPEKKIDFGLLYRAEKLIIVPVEIINVRQDAKLIHSAVHFEINMSKIDIPLTLFVLHWPSRRFTEHEAKRQTAALHLHQVISKLKESDENKHIMVMGDFNDEPYNHSLSVNLCAKRDRAAARAENTRLYNPFWRHLGERRPLEEETSSLHGRVAGTYWYQNQWFTFDQILVSGSLLSNSGWIFNESGSGILIGDRIIDTKKGKPLEPFDHLPIIAEFNYRTNDY